MRLVETSPLRQRADRATALAAACACVYFAGFDAALARASALHRAASRRHATLAAWDRAVALYRKAETLDLRAAYQSDKLAAEILRPHGFPEIPISVAFGN